MSNKETERWTVNNGGYPDHTVAFAGENLPSWSVLSKFLSH